DRSCAAVERGQSHPGAAALRRGNEPTDPGGDHGRAADRRLHGRVFRAGHGGGVPADTPDVPIREHLGRGPTGARIVPHLRETGSCTYDEHMTNRHQAFARYFYYATPGTGRELRRLRA